MIGYCFLTVCLLAGCLEKRSRLISNFRLNLFCWWLLCLTGTECETCLVAPYVDKILVTLEVVSPIFCP